MNFKQFFYFDKSRLTFAGFLILASAVALAWIELSKPKIKTANDLYFIKGHFRNYNFSKNGGRYTTYTFRLQEFSNSFKIKADFLGGFDIDKFKTIGNGDDLTLSISKDDINNLNTGNSYFFVFSITNNVTPFLAVDYTIAKHNSNIIYYASALSIILGFTSIYFGRQWKRKQDKLQLVD